MQYRKSQEDIKHMVSKRTYTKSVPPELQPYMYYISDSGHCIMCVLQFHLKEAKAKGMDNYEIPVPIKYVLEKGYKIVEGFVVVDARYDSDTGLEINEKYYEY